VLALDRITASAAVPLEAWSVSEAERPADLPHRVTFRGIGGNHWRLAAATLASGGISGGTLVVVMHVHLLPAVLPLILRGARLLTVMLGIEVWKPLRALERAALRRSWRIAAISAHTISRFRQANPGLRALAVSVCHPHVPPAAAGGDRVVPGRFALIVGRMSSAERYKGHDLLIDLWPGLVARVPDARLVVGGGGDDADRLRAKAAALQLGDRVEFLGWCPAADLTALYRDAVCFAMPSRGEGFGIVYLEAMREGTPCVAAPGAAAEIITDGVDGLIADPADQPAVADALARLFVDEPLRVRLGAAAAARVAGTFTADRFAARLSALVMEC
jgi:phosphatidylinositol alpha-1,6-mannosyltransferase